METKRLIGRRLLIAIHKFMREYPKHRGCLVFQYLKTTGDVIVRWEHWRYLDPRAAPPIYIGKFNEPKLTPAKLTNTYYYNGTPNKQQASLYTFRKDRRDISA